ncbi:hypothetical protein [Bacillus sp. NTK034]|nr:hypothetical protein [Bacillus sp. NTK034]
MLKSLRVKEMDVISLDNPATSSFNLRYLYQILKMLLQSPG